MKARFPGVCPVCNHKIHSGDSVIWERGSKAIHENCPTVDGYIKSYRGRNPKRSIEFISHIGDFHIFATDGRTGRHIHAVNLDTNDVLYLSRRDEILKEIADLESRLSLFSGSDRWDVVSGQLLSLRFELDKYVIFDSIHEVQMRS